MAEVLGRTTLLCVLSIALVQTCVALSLRSTTGAESSLSYPYTFKLTKVSTSYLQTVSANSASGTACSGQADCVSKCPTENFLTSGNATFDSVQQQLIDCANAFRTSPEVFADAINAVCNFGSFQNSITNPRRRAFAPSSQLSQLAEGHTLDMAANNSFQHQSSTGMSPADRIRTVFPNANAVGEVIAAGYTSVRDVIVNLMCSDPHRAILTSCDYDTSGWGAQYGSSVNGQQIRATYASYFTGNFLCSVASGCTCNQTSNAPAPAQSINPNPYTSPPQAANFGQQSPSGQNGQASPPVRQNPPVQQSPPAQQPPPVQTTLPPQQGFQQSPPVQTTLPPQQASQQNPPQQSAGGPPNPSGTAVAISFDVLFDSIPSGSLNAAQAASVADDLRFSITNYIRPVSAGISINGTGPPPSVAPASPPLVANRQPGASSGSAIPSSGSGSPPPTNSNQGIAVPGTSPGAPQPPINYNPPSPSGFPPPPINYNPPSPNTGRRLQQAENTVQATVTFLATTSAAPSADISSLNADLSQAINAYTAPTTTKVTSTPGPQGPTLNLQVSVQYPPNNQVSTTPGYTTQLASSFASAVANQTSQVLASFIAKDGAVKVSNVQTAVVPVTATAATNLPPPSPIPVNGGGSAGYPTSSAGPPASNTPAKGAPVAVVPPPAATPGSSTPVVTQIPAPTPSPAPASGQSPTPNPAAATPQTLTTTPGGAPPPQAPARTSQPLLLQAVVTFRSNESAMIQNFTQALQSTPQAVLYPVIAQDGSVTVRNVQSSAGSSAAIEEASPLPTVAAPIQTPVIAPTPAQAPGVGNG